MSETKEDGDKTIRGSRTMTLNLKRTVESGHVRQSFSHGRSKPVLVEKKKKRVITPAGGKAEETEAVTEAKSAETQAPVKQSEATPEALRGLSRGEREARERALTDEKVRESERKVKEEADNRRRAEEARKREEAGPAEPPVVEDEEETRKKADFEAKRKAEETRKKADAGDDDDAEARKKTADARAKRERAEPRPVKRRGDAADRVRGKLTITNALDDDQRQRSLASLRRRQERQKKQLATHLDSGKKISREVIVPEVITIQELANRMAERAVDVIKFMMAQGQMLKINDPVDADTAQIIAEEFGHGVKRVSEADVEEGFIGEEDDSEDLQTRAPIVTVMGHVDHGKTSLLDAIRQANVVSGEAGGITQHIGAYQVDINDQRITFIDTPGHEAFTAMRARGAKVTDLVILVVAADDGVMPQTVEAINHARAAGVPMIVAINKIDKPNVDPKRVRTDLLQHEIVVESLGGDVLDVEVSALKKTNLDKLLEMILLQAEVLELKANPDRFAEGVVIEAKLERGRGSVGTVLVQRGSLHVGDIIVAGAAWGKVRALLDDHGDPIEDAGPSVPVEVLGFDSAPEAGDQFAVVDSEGRAREITAYRARKRREIHNTGAGARGTLEQMMSQLKDGARKEFPLLIKGDVQGSIEAIVSALDKLGTDEVRARVMHSGVGGITESDVSLASATGAPIFGFNVRANVQARHAAERDRIDIRYYSVIYDLVDDVKKAMSGLLDPTLREHFLGNAEILEVFNISKVGRIAGCRVTEGKVARGASVRLIRDNVVIHEGKLSTLKRFKDEVSEVPNGQECGMAFENYQDMKAGDIIECFRVETVIRTL